MKAWINTRLGNLFDVKAGGDLQVEYYSEKFSKETPYPIFSNSLNEKGLYGFTSRPRYPKECITLTGRGEIGNAEYRSEPFDAIVRLLVLIPKNKVDCKFITYYINQQINFAIESTGVPQLPAPRIKKLKIHIPSLVTEQTAIATILSKVDEDIDATQNTIKATEKLKKALMQNLLTGKLKPDGTWRTEDEFYIDEKFGNVPVGWKPRKLKNVCTEPGQYGANASSVDFTEGKPRYIRITDIDDNGNLSENGKVGIETSKVNAYILKENDFLFARTGDTVGKSLLYKESMGFAAYAGYLIKFTFDNEVINPDYFNLVAKSDFFEAFKVAMKRVGAKPNINSREYGSFKFILPKDIDEQDLIVAKVLPFQKNIRTKQSKIQTLQHLKKSLMQHLLTGKKRVDLKKFNEIVNTKR